MQALDVNSLFARAEQAFGAGRLEQARADLGQVQRLAGQHPAVLHLLALVEKKRGFLDTSRRAFEGALKLAPGDPQINNNYANLLRDVGDEDAALHHYGQALGAAPQFEDALYNRALLLKQCGRLEEALLDIDRAAMTSRGSAKVQSARGAILRALGRLSESASAYDSALAAEPTRLIALHGRARVAMERGEETASEWYRRALLASAGDPDLELGLAEALEAEGNSEGLERLAAAVGRRPEWTEGQTVLARMRWEAGEGKSFARAIEDSIRTNPDNEELWLTLASALSSANLHHEAADVAARATAALGGSARFQLLEAFNASEAGDLDRADRIFALLPQELAGRSIDEAAHLIRRGKYEQALAVADAIRAEDLWSVSVWALTGVLWRLTADPRSEWLHGQPNLIATYDLELQPAELEAIASRVRSLHRTRAHPVGQSLRGGTQTRGRLFDREEPEVLLLRGAIERAVERYWASLPASDMTHPLLRASAHRPRFTGSWSVRLTSGGFHVAHFHPEGLVSSACYLTVPPSTSGREGWLEMGRPPTSLGVNLPAVAEVEPRPGRLALFPSTLFHGTRKFSAGERLTVAFDVAAS